MEDSKVGSVFEQTVEFIEQADAQCKRIGNRVASINHRFYGEAPKPEREEKQTNELRSISDRLTIARNSFDTTIAGLEEEISKTEEII